MSTKTNRRTILRSLLALPGIATLARKFAKGGVIPPGMPAIIRGDNILPPRLAQELAERLNVRYVRTTNMACLALEIGDPVLIGNERCAVTDIVAGINQVTIRAVQGFKLPDAYLRPPLMAFEAQQC